MSLSLRQAPVATQRIGSLGAELEGCYEQARRSPNRF